MLMSVDGKITSGNSDEWDADKDWQTIEGGQEGLHQYYEIEQTTDLWSLNTGRVMEKIGVNTRPDHLIKSAYLVSRKIRSEITIARVKNRTVC